MAHIAELPLGFIGEMGSGKIRRIVSDSSAAHCEAHRHPAVADDVRGLGIVRSHRNNLPDDSQNAMSSNSRIFSLPAGTA